MAVHVLHRGIAMKLAPTKNTVDSTAFALAVVRRVADTLLRWVGCAAAFRTGWVVLLLVALSLATARADEHRPLVFGVLNQQSAIRTAEKWNPLLRYLSQKTGIPFQLKMGPNVAATDAMMGQGEFDLVFTNHNFQREFDGMYRVIARWAGKPIHGVIAVAEASPIKRLEDLHGRTVAFPSPDAFVAYAVPTVALTAGGIAVNPRFAGNQEGAMAQLKAGQVDAAAVNSRFLDDYSQREDLRHRRVFVSDPYLDLPVIVHPRVPADTVDKVRRAVLDMRNDPAAAPLLLQAGSQGFEAAKDADYDDVRRIYRAIGQ